MTPSDVIEARMRAANARCDETVEANSRLVARLDGRSFRALSATPISASPPGEQRRACERNG